MKKLAQLIKNHLDGKQTVASKEVMYKISKKLQEYGFKAPFKVVKVSQFNKNDPKHIVDQFYDGISFDIIDSLNEMGLDPEMMEKLHGMPEKLELAKQRNPLVRLETDVVPFFHEYLSSDLESIDLEQFSGQDRQDIESSLHEQFLIPAVKETCKKFSNTELADLCQNLFTKLVEKNEKFQDIHTDVNEKFQDIHTDVMDRPLDDEEDPTDDQLRQMFQWGR